MDAAQEEPETWASLPGPDGPAQYRALGGCHLNQTEQPAQPRFGAVRSLFYLFKIGHLQHHILGFSTDSENIQYIKDLTSPKRLYSRESIIFNKINLIN